MKFIMISLTASSAHYLSKVIIFGFIRLGGLYGFLILSPAENSEGIRERSTMHSSMHSSDRKLPKAVTLISFWGEERSVEEPNLRLSVPIVTRGSRKFIIRPNSPTIFHRHAHNTWRSYRMAASRAMAFFRGKRKNGGTETRRSMKDTFPPSHPNHEQCRQSRIVIVHESNALWKLNNLAHSRLDCDCWTIKTARCTEEY